MKLYSYWRSSSSWRVRAALAFKGQEYEYVALDLLEGAHQTPAFKNSNPVGQVPALEIEGEELAALGHASPPGGRVTVSQSVAIVELLEELFPTPSLFPEESWARARVRQMVEVVNSGIQPLQNLAVLKAVEGAQGKDAAKTWGASSIERGLGALEALATPHAGTFLFGNALTLADIYLVPQLYNARRFDVSLCDFPVLARAEEAALGHPALRASHPDAQPDAPQTRSSAP